MKTYWLYYKMGRDNIHILALLGPPVKNSYTFIGHFNAQSRGIALRALEQHLSNFNTRLATPNPLQIHF